MLVLTKGDVCHILQSSPEVLVFLYKLFYARCYNIRVGWCLVGWPKNWRRILGFCRGSVKVHSVQTSQLGVKIIVDTKQRNYSEDVYERKDKSVCGVGTCVKRAYL